MKKLLLTFMALTAAIGVFAKYSTVEGQLDGSTIYPGTIHTYILTIPEGVSEGALYVGLDGILCNAPEIIDSLSTAGVMPPTFGLYLQPGRILDENGEVLRYNRSNEFDATDSRFASFLEKELLPYVEIQHNVKFSKNPNDRMIFGLSSGGIAAFTAAWHRPDLFSKVFSGCGTFVPMRGGHDLQTIVRKHEPKPLRIFLQDGYDDAWNALFGSWFEANYVLGTALEFAGYDCKFDWGEGVHSVKRSSEIFKDVMLWMWRNYPAGITAGTTQNNYIAPLLIAGENWIKTNEGNEPNNEKVYAIYPDGSHGATPYSNSNYIAQYLIDKDGKNLFEQPFYWLHSYDNSKLNIPSLKFDGDGMLWVLTNAGIQICDQNGRVRGILSLPQDLSDIVQCSIEILDGEVKIKTPVATYSRHLNVKAPEKGIRPKSQGQA